jgi:predicted nuclease of predicted toxin-antitoxin system
MLKDATPDLFVWRYAEFLETNMIFITFDYKFSDAWTLRGGDPTL